MNIMNFLLESPIDMPPPFAFESWLSFWMVVVVSAVNAMLMVLVGYKFLQIIQLSGYRLKGFFAWLKDTKAVYWGRLIMLSFLSSAALLITNVLLEDFFKYKIMTYLGLTFYLVFTTLFIFNQYSTPQKTPLKYTYRMNRLCIMSFILVFISTFFSLTLSDTYLPYFKYGAVGLMPVFLPIIVLLAFLINYPFEYFNNLRYQKKAEKKLLNFPNLIKIGITGSYGKTSVKTILTTILSEKYKVCATPLSYNTPMGISKTVLGELNANDQVFIAEMGAKQVGDIAVLCSMVKPDIGLLTSVGNQHLSTFGSLENIKKTKNELVVGIKQNGKMFFNGDNVVCRELFTQSKLKKKFISSICDKNDNIWADKITSTSRGSTFTVCAGGSKFECETSLLGEHNVSNIILCISVALSLGLTIEQIQKGVSRLSPAPHRLAIVPSSASLIVIDDAYNGSVEGSRAALTVLSSFMEGKKVVITPGLVELGSESFNSNFQLGIYMAKVCDYVIINGVVNYEAIYNGLIFGGMQEDNIFRAGTLKQAVDILSDFTSPGDVVLFENDLPDNYT